MNIGSSKTAVGACEGIEGAVINMYSGDYDLYCSDDCLNAANSDLSEQNYQYQMNIYGGDVYAVCTGEGDVLDSNGTVTMTGGNVVAVAGEMGNVVDTGTDGNTAIDDTFKVTGGTLFGIGMSDMAIVPSSDSQSWAAWGYGTGSGQPGGGMNFNPGGNQSNTGGFSGGFGTASDSSTGSAPSGAPSGAPGGSSSGVPSGAPMGDNAGGAAAGLGSASTTATNMSDSSALTLKVGSNSYSVGSSVSISSGSTVSVLNNSTEIASTKAMNSASFVLYCAPIVSTGSGSSSSGSSGSGSTSGSESNSGSAGTSDSTGTADTASGSSSAGSSSSADAAAGTAAAEPITINKTPSLLRVTSKKKSHSITLKWKAIKKKSQKKLWKSVQRIEVQYASNPEFTDAVTRSVKKSKSQVTLKGLQQGGIYYVRMRYCNGTGYSNWSKIKCVKVK